MRAIFFVLFTVVAGEALPPDAIPVKCAAICGPIVELSSMCSPKRSLGDLDSRSLNPREPARHARRHDGKRVEEEERREKRFSVIIPAPTTFPPDLVAGSYVPASSPAAWEAPAAPAQPPAQNYAPPTQPQPTPAPAPALPTTSNSLTPTPPPVAPPSPTPSSVRPPTVSVGTKKQMTVLPTSTSGHRTSSTPAKTVSGGSIGEMTNGREEMENAEEKCVCQNTSFNVAEIAGLCASCIGMIADTQNDMQVIMSVCGFPSQQYSPDKDKLASNIWVKATRPTAGATANGASRSTRCVSIGAIMGMGFTIGALMML
ncbi:hypothetical protein BBK36DRAFT_1121056 [Trichoderma citrinoviride]|uniref:Uncharacterized protein n=1 Tax=Trichoderma citrinoviride TaxID=58853 RepID=A0A2T4B8Q0_9HYPO|nr:hypothetical protein BBK36DRAFT_1121056 [Trichoderma citrinoviride]PTB65668.1 hypothetical protein BBK36DRAFT_1121056 [Trichoderma citrinoviride]